LNVTYNASNNELVRTNTLVKNGIIQIDATEFKKWYLKHYAVELGKKIKKAEGEKEVKKSKHVLGRIAGRVKANYIDPKVEEQFASGRLYAAISSRPGQSGRCDGYILEGKELEFYLKKMEKRTKA